MPRKRRAVDEATSKVAEKAMKQVAGEIKQQLGPPDGQAPDVVPFAKSQLQLLVAAQADVQAAQLRAQLVLNTICAGLGIDSQRIIRLEAETDPPHFLVVPEDK